MVVAEFRKFVPPRRRTRALSPTRTSSGLSIALVDLGNPGSLFMAATRGMLAEDLGLKVENESLRVEWSRFEVLPLGNGWVHNYYAGDGGEQLLNLPELVR